LWIRILIRIDFVRLDPDLDPEPGGQMTLQKSEEISYFEVLDILIFKKEFFPAIKF
jgi:hypothetical protein